MRRRNSSIASASAVGEKSGHIAGVVNPPDSGKYSHWVNEKLPADPWGRPYQYVNPGVKGEIDVFSYGADGQAGGEGHNADIGSWQ